MKQVQAAFLSLQFVDKKHNEHTKFYHPIGQEPHPYIESIGEGKAGQHLRPSQIILADGVANTWMASNNGAESRFSNCLGGNAGSPAMHV